MRFKTSEKAAEFFVRGEIEVVDETQHFNHYLVGPKKREVFYILNKHTGEMEYSCDTVSDDKSWSCCLFKGDQTEPFCKHTKAVKLFRNQIKFKTKRKETIVQKIERRKQER